MYIVLLVLVRCIRTACITPRAELGMATGVDLSVRLSWAYACAWAALGQLKNTRRAGVVGVRIKAKKNP